MRRGTRVMRTIVGFAAAALVLSGCDFSVYKLPLPGGASTGDNPMSLTVEFADVLDLVPQSAVRVNDVAVGRITDIQLDGFVAQVEVEIRGDLGLPSNAVAEVRQTSLLGEKFVSIAAPEQPSATPLADGDVIPLDRTGRNPEVEEVLGALSMLLNGGGVAQLQVITRELNQALEGRESSARSVLTQIDTLMGTLDDNRGDIVDAIEALNRLSISVNGQMDTIDAALTELPSALRSIDGQRRDLVRMLEALDDLSSVGVEVIRQSKAGTIESLERLAPVLTRLAESGDDFANSFHVVLTYPFVDEVVGRDPQVARNLHMGDYTNLSIQLDLDFRNGLPGVPGLPIDECHRLEDIPPLGPINLEKLCEDALKSVQACLQQQTVAACAGLPAGVLRTVCEDAGPLSPVCNLLGGLGGLGGGNTSGNGGNGGGTRPGLPALPPLLPGLGASSDGGVLGGLLGGSGGGGLLGGLLGSPRAAFGAPTLIDPERGPTLAQLTEIYDPGLASLLVPGLATTAEGKR